MTPTYAKNTELEGENYAPSSSSFQKPANVHTKAIRLLWGIFWEAAYRILSIKNRTRIQRGAAVVYAIPEWIPVSWMVLRCRASQTDKDHSDGS